MSSIPDPDAPRLKLQHQILWIVWSSNLLGLGLFYLLLHNDKTVERFATANPLINLAGFVPLFVSIIIRWLVIHRASQPGSILIIFVIGIALAEACGLLGLLLGGPYRDSLFALGVMGVTTYVPLFTKRLMSAKHSGFIPNN